MRMNSTNYKQYDTRWCNLPYPTKRWNIGNSGCGEVSICNTIIEMSKQAKQTPKTIQPYCVQYAAPNGDGTYWSGIPAMMKHYGMTEVKEHGNMSSLWKELAKGNRVAVYLMNSVPAGKNKVHWTSGGHFVSSVNFKLEGGDYWVYMKDPNSTSPLRNGWISYSGNIRGACVKVWSGKLNGSPAPEPTPPTPTGKLKVDGDAGYETIKRLQEFLGLSDPEGIISGQPKTYAKYFPAISAVSYGNGGSNTVYALQKWLGMSSPDGILGKKTATALQKKLGLKDPDGIIGKNTVKALQKYLNDQLK